MGSQILTIMSPTTPPAELLTDCVYTYQAIFEKVYPRLVFFLYWVIFIQRQDYQTINIGKF